jgi:glycosidase
VRDEKAQRRGFSRIAFHIVPEIGANVHSGRLIVLSDTFFATPAGSRQEILSQEYCLRMRREASLSASIQGGSTMSFRDTVLGQARPSSVRAVDLPRREKFFPSPADWRDEVIYFLLPDRFSDGREAGRPMLDRRDLAGARPPGFRFDDWARSGGDRYQGGTIAGITSKLDYLGDLGVTTLWVGPVFKQRAHLNTFHGYAIQDFLEVDPRFGTRADLVALVDAAHAKGMRVILDVVFNHSGTNWIYADGQVEPPFLPFPGFYQKGDWVDGNGGLVSALAPAAKDSGVWPSELQADAYYSRAGGTSFDGDFEDDHAPFRRTDFFALRDFNFDGTEALDDLARCYKYWLALTDCDGFRMDTLKHVSAEAGRNFCGSIKEFAGNLGKANFFLIGEVAGSDDDAEKYRRVLGLNLSATLDIGGIRRVLHGVAKGLQAPDAYLDFSRIWDDDLGSHRDSGTRHVSVLDDHDHVSGEKVRFSTDAASERQVVAGVALQLFTLGIPCIYYGTEQSLAGPEKAVRDQFLPDFHAGTGTDRFLRETMFGPLHPRGDGRAGLGPGDAGRDTALPGFGPFGTAGRHCFDPGAAAYVRIAALAAVRRKFPVLRCGRQYQRQLSNFQRPFAFPGPGELIAWSRILDDEEALCIVNGHGTASRGGDVLVDARLNRKPGAELVVLANTGQTATPGFAGSHPVGQRLPVKFRDGTAFVEIRDLGPSEVLLLVNHP